MARGHPPFADFAVFGPFGKRFTARRKFTAQTLVDGEWVTKQIRGPASFEAWQASWRVFRCAMIMLREASPATLDSYEAGLHTLSSLHGPEAWGVLVTVDEVMCGERWEAIKEDFHRDIRRDGLQVPERPWDAII